jgi:hypothetical protein
MLISLRGTAHLPRTNSDNVVYEDVVESYFLEQFSVHIRHTSPTHVQSVSPVQSHTNTVLVWSHFKQDE